MKMIRKYTNMAFLLLSIVSIAPAYSNEKIINENQEKQKPTAKKTEKTPWYYKKIANTGATRGEIAAYMGFLASVSAFIWYTGLWKGIMPVKQLCNICSSNQQKELQPYNSISGVTVFGTITQTDGNNTTIIIPGKKPIWVKQDSAGTWIRHDASSPWILSDSILSAK